MRLLRRSIFLSLLALSFLLWCAGAPVQRAHAATASVDNPYGFTDTLAPTDNFTAQAVMDMHDVGLSWVRAQESWSTIETSKNVYDWSLLDQAVARANAGNVNLVFPIRNAPSWHLTQTCTSSDGHKQTFPGVQDMVTFATAVAQRYTNEGHGSLAAIQIGNEDWDNAQFGNESQSAQCRAPSFYAPVLSAASQAIKAVNPSILVISAGLFWKQPQHIHDWYAYLYQHGDANAFDFGDFHYYMCNTSIGVVYDPNVGGPNGTSFSSDWPTLDTIFSAFQQANTENNVTKSLWITETGYTINGNNQPSQCVVSQQTVANDMTEELDDARLSNGLVAKVFWFTMDEGTNGMSITQGTSKTIAYTTLKHYVAAHPTWP